VPEAYALLRLVLENTLYGYYFSKKPASREIWLNRHESEELKRKVREEFKIRNLLNVLKDSDPDLGKAIEILYERVIDYGAHPNERALTHNLKLTSDEEKHEFLVIYLSNDSDSLRLALRTAAQTGTGTLAAFRLIYKERFDLLGLTDILKQLRKVL
jgi:dsDNA-binding SOS-regulon protein